MHPTLLKHLPSMVCLLIAFFSSTVFCSQRFLVLQGYADGLPYTWRTMSNLREKLENKYGDIVLHTYSLDAYIEHDEDYGSQVASVLNSTFQNKINGIIITDKGATHFFNEYLKSSYADTPVLKIFEEPLGPNDLNEGEYAVLLEFNYSEAVSVVQHHYPDLRRIVLIGELSREQAAREQWAVSHPTLEIISLSHLSYEKMLRQIQTLQKGDLLFYQLLFSDGEGNPMVPPLEYGAKFAAASPVPMICSYQNFIERGCLGGSVSSPVSEANAIFNAISNSLIKPTINSNKTATKQQIFSLYASRPVIDVKQLKHWGLNLKPKENVMYLNILPPFHQRFADELAILQLFSIILIITLLALRVGTNRRQKLERRLATLAREAPIALLWRLKPNGRWMPNALFERWAEAARETPSSLIHNIIEQIQRKPLQEQTFVIINNDGPRYCQAHTAEDKSGEDLILLEDITDRHHYEEKLRKIAHTDDLTGLANRRMLLKQAALLVGQSKRSNARFALMLIDLDGFKAVNDSLGHDIGDTVLQHVASLLESVTRQGDIVARIGGDEFCILVTSNPDESGLQKMSLKLHQIVSSADELSQVNIGFSIGIALYPDDANNIDQLIQRADHSMYTAKSQGKGRSCFYKDLSATKHNNHN